MEFTDALDIIRNLKVCNRCLSIDISAVTKCHTCAHNNAKYSDSDVIEAYQMAEFAIKQIIKENENES